MSRRSDVIAEVIARLEAELEEVFRDREAFNEEDNFPLANVIIGESKAVNKALDIHKYQIELPISIEVVNIDKTDDPFPQIEALLDQCKRLIMVDNDLKKLCKEFTFDGDSEAGRQSGGKFISVSADFTFKYTENHCKEE